MKLVTTILIADDHHLMRRGLRGLLESHLGWEVVAEAEDGYEAIDAAIRTSPDVAIIDSSMPRMNGVESARRIHQQLPKVEVCLFSDCDDESVIASALRGGARGFVLKSATEDELIAAVEALSMHHPYFSWVVSESLLDHYVKQNGISPQIALLTPRERE